MLLPSTRRRVPLLAAATAAAEHRHAPGSCRTGLVAALRNLAPAEAAELMEIAPVTLRANLFKARSRIRRRVFQLSPALAERFAAVEEPRELADGACAVTTRIAS